MITSSASFGSAAMLRLARKKGNTCRMRSNATWEDLINALEMGPVMVRMLIDSRRVSMMVLGWDYKTVLMKDSNGIIARISKETFMQQWTVNECGWMMTIA